MGEDFWIHPMMPGKEKAAGEEETKVAVDGPHKRSHRLSLQGQSRAVRRGHGGHRSSTGASGGGANSAACNMQEPSQMEVTSQKCTVQVPLMATLQMTAAENADAYRLLWC